MEKNPYPQLVNFNFVLNHFLIVSSLMHLSTMLTAQVVMATTTTASPVAARSEA
jgi:hypothetical protein